MSAPPIVVLRSNDILFTGLLRSVAAAGAIPIPVIFTWPGAGPWYSEASCHFRNAIQIANPFTNAEQAVEDMIALGEKLRAKYGQPLMVLPSSDTNLMFMLDHYDRFSPYFYMMGNRHFDQARLDVLEKDRCAALLESKGIAAPKTFACKNKHDITIAAENVPYPCVYKPTRKDYGQSFYRAHQGRKAIRCENKDELEKEASDRN
ncbi:MAG: hypothetical protein IPJ88_12090 [Myxococcales bacterium]|nr:MAG: hypothetical protein IPJ88_12090 [Myxococcales bacterium]